MHIRDESSGPAVAGEEADQSLSAGEVNEALMKMLLEQGRLNLDQVIAAAAQNLEQPVDEARELLQRHFLGLVQVLLHCYAAPCAAAVFLHILSTFCFCLNVIFGVALKGRVRRRIMLRHRRILVIIAEPQIARRIGRPSSILLV